MRGVAILGVLTVAMLAVAATPGGEYNEVLKVGDAAPAWVNLDGVDGKKHSLSDLKDKEVVVVVFTCNSCPIAVDYEERILAFAKKYTAGGKVALVAVNVNTVEEDRLPAMQKRAKEKGFDFAYLYDPSQKIAKDFGATYTPEFFVLDKQRRVAYLGAMDDRNQAAAVKINYLEPAVEAALAGKKANPGETLARGCRIRFEKKKM